MKNFIVIVLIQVYCLAFFPIFLFAGDKEVSFIVMGDTRGDMVKTHINQQFLDILKKKIIEEKPDFIFVNGDLVNGYSEKLESQLVDWRGFFMAPLLKRGLNVYVCRGNHDVSEGWVKHKYAKALDAWNRTFSGKFSFPDNGPEKEKNLTYFVKKNNTVVFVFDNYIDKAHHQVNYKWMTDVLEKMNAKKNNLKVFALCHEPAYAAQHPDCLAVRKEKRDNFIKAFLDNGGVFFFSGHDHFYNHATVKAENGLFHQFICGTSGAPLRKWNKKYSENKVKNVSYIEKRGYVKVIIRGDDVKLEYIVYSSDDGTWKVEDSVSKVTAGK